MYRKRPGGRPARQGLSYYVMSASAYAVIGIFAALGADASDPHVRAVEVGLYETGLYLASGLLVGEQYRENAMSTVEDPASFARPGYGAYQTADARWIYLL